MIELGPNRYGKSAIRVVRVLRGPGGHQVRDLTVAIALEGDFEAAHIEGDNALVIATDTMKNTAYAFAAEHLDGSVEAYGRALAEHFFGHAQVALARVDIRQHPWQAIETPKGPAPDAFERAGGEVRTAIVTTDEGGTTIEAGLDGLTVMKTTRSAFSGFPRDRYTTLAETSDRIMATEVSATWRYGPGGGAAASDLDHDAEHAAIRRTLLGVFADHDSVSVQASMWLIGRAVLERHAAVDEIRMTMPNLHHWRVDLTPFGMEDRGEVFVATREPHGRIEATIRRSDAS